MRLLPDTHMLLWAAEQSARLPPMADALLNDPDNQVFFSVASIWEASIKFALNRTDFTLHPATLREGLLGAGYTEIDIQCRHVLAVLQLPALHRDPFDRMLIAQAMVEGCTLLTADPVLARYPGPVRLA